MYILFYIVLKNYSLPKSISRIILSNSYFLAKNREINSHIWFLVEFISRNYCWRYIEKFLNFYELFLLLQRNGWFHGIFHCKMVDKRKICVMRFDGISKNCLAFKRCYTRIIRTFSFSNDFPNFNHKINLDFVFYSSRDYQILNLASLLTSKWTAHSL